MICDIHNCEAPIVVDFIVVFHISLFREKLFCALKRCSASHKKTSEDFYMIQ